MIIMFVKQSAAGFDVCCSVGFLDFVRWQGYWLAVDLLYIYIYMCSEEMFRFVIFKLVEAAL